MTAEARARLQPVVAGYLEAQRALAHDDVEGAQRVLADLAPAIEAWICPGHRPLVTRGSASPRSWWGPLAADSAGAATGEVRNAFEQLSNAVIAMLQTFGNPGPEPLRVNFCPMAFDARGAEWVQTEEVVANPYYGPTMQLCGELRAVVMPGERPDTLAGIGSRPPAEDEHEQR